MDAFRRAAGPKANLQTLARGISVVALKAQPKDIIKLHAETFKKHGITTIRNFDALNDVQNLIWSGQCIRNAGLKHEVAVTLMELPPGCSGAHEVDFYETTLRRILDSGLPYDSIVFKDASGTSRPQKVYETIKMARRVLGEKMKLSFHSHETAGTCVMAYKAAIDAGVNQIDLSVAPVSGGTSQPDVLTMWHALRGTEFTLDIDIQKIIRLEQMFKEAMKDYFVPPEAKAVEPLIPFFPMPGGALTANTQMLRDNNLMDKYADVIAAMGDVVKRGGFGTSVTPVSQFYFQQAFNNVMFEPWSKIAEGYGKMVLGYFGKTPVPPYPEVVQLASRQLKLEPSNDHLAAIEQDARLGTEYVREILKNEGLPVTEENLFIVASCEEKGIAFLKGQGVIGVRKNQPKSEEPQISSASSKVAATTGPTAYNVAVEGHNYRVVLDGQNALVNGIVYAVGIFEAPSETKSTSSGGMGVGQPLITELPGLVLRVEKDIGSRVKVGDTVLVIESMKMETAIVSPVEGAVAKICVKQGDQVQTGQLTAIIS
jgi:pyruvate carboxylase subunit B